MKKAEIKKIVLDLGDKEIELSLVQVKKLHVLLNDMFGEKKTEYIPTWPIIIDRYRQPHWDYPYQTWCDSTTDAKFNYLADTKTVNIEVT